MQILALVIWSNYRIPRNYCSWFNCTFIFIEQRMCRNKLPTVAGYSVVKLIILLTKTQTLMEHPLDTWSLSLAQERHHWFCLKVLVFVSKKLRNIRNNSYRFMKTDMQLRSENKSPTPLNVESVLSLGEWMPSFSFTRLHVQTKLTNYWLWLRTQLNITVSRCPTVV